MRVVTITISTSRAAGAGDDLSTTALAAFTDVIGGRVVAAELIPDDRDTITARLRHWADSESVDLVLTAGGTGLSSSDVTPDATREVIDREAPGIAEAMRLASREHTPHWMLSRGVAGMRHNVLIINFPGTPSAIAQAGAPLVDVMGHALDQLLDRPTHHDEG